MTWTPKLLLHVSSAAAGQGLGGVAFAAAAHQAPNGEGRARRIDIGGAFRRCGARAHAGQTEQDQQTMADRDHGKQRRGAKAFDQYRGQIGCKDRPHGKPEHQGG